MNSFLPAHQQLILQCSRTDCDEREIRCLAEERVDVEAFRREAIETGLVPLIWASLRKVECLPSAIAPLREHSRQNMVRNLFLEAELLSIGRMFQESGIPFVPVKGVVLAEAVYRDLGLREMADLDVLLREEDVSRGLGVLLRNGFEGGPVDFSGRDVTLFRKSGFVDYALELHWRFKDSFLSLPTKVLWENLVPFRLQGFEFSILSPEMTLIQLTHHLHYEGYPLKILADVSETIRGYRDVIDWPRVISLVRDWRMQRNFVCALEAARKVLGCPLPPAVLDLCESQTDRSWVLKLVSDPRWYFSKNARWIRRGDYRRALLSSLFVDGSWTSSFSGRAAYWLRKRWRSRAPFKRGIRGDCKEPAEADSLYHSTIR